MRAGMLGRHDSPDDERFIPLQRAPDGFEGFYARSAGLVAFSDRVICAADVQARSETTLRSRQIYLLDGSCKHDKAADDRV